MGRKPASGRLAAKDGDQPEAVDDLRRGNSVRCAGFTCPAFAGGN